MYEEALQSPLYRGSQLFETYLQNEHLKSLASPDVHTRIPPQRFVQPQRLPEPRVVLPI
jgi:hypothetical protein